MQISEKTLYNEYLSRHRRKQNRGANGTRDSERSKTYSAEFKMLSMIDNPTFKDIPEAQRCAKKIYKSKTWQKLWRESTNSDVTRLFFSTPEVVAKFKNSGRGTAGFTDGQKVTLDTRVGLNKYTLLHELTHCLGHMHHGRSFRYTLLKMVGAFMGAKEKKILASEFKKRKLAYGKAKKPLEFEQWKEMRNRLEKIRNVT
tara:strand:- start:2319 stop:2918 length:600 start_codon:yes stop_codon:yes gene_type:complete